MGFTVVCCELSLCVHSDCRFSCNLQKVTVSEVLVFVLVLASLVLVLVLVLACPVLVNITEYY